METAFRTYFDVSEYGNYGFSELHRIIASSLPLTLWAPPGILIKEHNRTGMCRIATRDVLEYVESGLIQIIGRERWFNKANRDNHPWEGAKWVDGFDDEIVRIYNEDLRLPEDQRRVRSVEPEDGYTWVDEILERDSSTIDRTWKIIKSGKLPQGYREKAAPFQENRDKIGAARAVLRNARNQVRSIELSRADVPFFTPDEVRFFRELEVQKIPISSESFNKVRIRNKLIEITKQIPELLYCLDQLQKPKTLQDFMGSDGHKELARFMSQLSEIVQYVEFEEIDYFVRNYISKRLAEEIERGLPSKSLINIMGLSKKKPLLIIQVVGIIMAVFQYFFDVNNIINLAGLGMAIIPTLYSFSQSMGVFKPDYSGTEWPFLYTYGYGSPSNEEIRLMKRLLIEFSNELRRL